MKKFFIFTAFLLVFLSSCERVRSLYNAKIGVYRVPERNSVHIVLLKTFRKQRTMSAGDSNAIRRRWPPSFCPQVKIRTAKHSEQCQDGLVYECV